MKAFICFSFLITATMAAPSGPPTDKPATGTVNCGGIHSKPHCCNEESGLCQLLDVLGICGADTMYCCNYSGNVSYDFLYVYSWINPRS